MVLAEFHCIKKIVPVSSLVNVPVPEEEEEELLEEGPVFPAFSWLLGLSHLYLYHLYHFLQRRLHQMVPSVLLVCMVRITVMATKLFSRLSHFWVIIPD